MQGVWSALEGTALSMPQHPFKTSVEIDNAGMKTIQYTVRGVQPKLDRVAHREAREQGISLNSLLLEVLARGLNVSEEMKTHHDLDELAGTWVENEEAEAVFNSMRKIDQELWQCG